MRCPSKFSLLPLNLSLSLSSFSEERVRKGAEKLQKYLNSKQQGRLDGFFTVVPKSPKKEIAGKEKGKAGNKRKVIIILLTS